jgi:hypothetical protein
MNKSKPHVYVIPEDDRDRQLAVGFVLHYGVDPRRIQVMEPAGGWSKVLDTFTAEYIGYLHSESQGHVVMLIDFDGDYDHRRATFEQAIPGDLKPRVFVLGSKQTPEDLKRQLGKSFEDIGTTLADDCAAGTWDTWSHDHLKHNDADRRRLVEIVRPFLFGDG